jgi:hypothetical protein
MLWQWLTIDLFQLSGVVAGHYVFKLRVEDEQGLFSEDTATVIVNPGTKTRNFLNA